MKQPRYIIHFAFALICVLVITACGTTNEPPPTEQELMYIQSLQGRIGKAKSALSTASVVLNTMHAKSQVSDKDALKYAEDIGRANEVLNTSLDKFNIGEYKESDVNLERALSIARDVLVLTGN